MTATGTDDETDDSEEAQAVVASTTNERVFPTLERGVSPIAEELPSQISPSGSEGSDHLARTQSASPVQQVGSPTVGDDVDAHQENVVASEGSSRQHPEPDNSRTALQDVTNTAAAQQVGTVAAEENSDDDVVESGVSSHSDGSGGEVDISQIATAELEFVDNEPVSVDQHLEQNLGQVATAELEFVVDGSATSHSDKDHVLIGSPEEDAAANSGLNRGSEQRASEGDDERIAAALLPVPEELKFEEQGGVRTGSQSSDEGRTKIEILLN